MTSETREQFTQLVAALRPELHRYCARMTGSVFDGEDLVQTVIEKAYVALADMSEPPQLRPWLFSIAHNAAMDFLKRYERRHVQLVAELPEPSLPREEVDRADVEIALSRFVRLPPLQRSALLLKDVLDHSLEEVAVTLGISIGAVKGALSRARANIKSELGPEAIAEPRGVTSEEQANLESYARLFNARDWEGLRSLLAAEAQLDLVTRVKRSVVEAKYYDRYAEILRDQTIRAESGWVDGRPAIAMYRPASSTTPTYFLLIAWSHGQITHIRDYYYVPYIASGASFDPR